MDSFTDFLGFDSFVYFRDQILSLKDPNFLSDFFKAQLIRPVFLFF